MELIATIDDPAVIRKILAPVGGSPSEQHPGPARPRPAPPHPELIGGAAADAVVRAP